MVWIEKASSIRQGRKLDRVRPGQVAGEQPDARAKAAESLAREIEHRSGEVHADELGLGLSVEHGLGDQSRADPEVEDGTGTDLRRREQGQQHLLLLRPGRKVQASVRIHASAVSRLSHCSIRATIAGEIALADSTSRTRRRRGHDRIRPVLAEGTIERPDGRVVAWATWGDPAGRPLLLLHGTPGSRFDRSSDPELYAQANAHVLTFDRPGYGRSSPHRDRTFVSVADDAAAVADAVGWDGFSVLGVSGGGPHALAVGARVPERVLALGLAVGVPPSDMIDPDDLIEINREAMRHAQQGRASLEEFLAESAAEIAVDPGGALDAAMADAPAVDRELLERPDIREVLLESIREAFANGPLGWFDDSWALSTPWGFELSEVTAPVNMWYGDLDRNVPIRAVRQMAAQLQVASFEIFPGAGHLGWLTHEGEVLSTLLDLPATA